MPSAKPGKRLESTGTTDGKRDALSWTKGRRKKPRRTRIEKQRDFAAPYWCVFWRAARASRPRSGRYFFLRAAAARGFFAPAPRLVPALVPALALGSDAAAGGLSPIIPLSGHILKAGHLRQPATMAIGQIVMAIPVDEFFNRPVCAPWPAESSRMPLKRSKRPCTGCGCTRPRYPPSIPAVDSMTKYGLGCKSHSLRQPIFVR